MRVSIDRSQQPLLVYVVVPVVVTVLQLMELLIAISCTEKFLWMNISQIAFDP